MNCQIISDELRRHDAEASLLKLIDHGVAPDVDALALRVAHSVYSGDQTAFERAYAEQLASNELLRDVFAPATEIRNRKWVSRIEALAASDACPCIFAVGAAHLIGPSGLPDLLRAQGAVVERLKGGDPAN